jgi:hypothetical protein
MLAQVSLTVDFLKKLCFNIFAVYRGSMSASFPIKAKLGNKVLAEDVLFTSSHPATTTINAGWTKTPAYAPISSVPLKATLADQFRRAAAASSEIEILDHVDRLLSEKDSMLRETRKISVANEERILSEAKTRQNTVDE